MKWLARGKNLATYVALRSDLNEPIKSRRKIVLPLLFSGRG